MTRRQPLIAVSAVAAAALYLLLWIGWVNDWNWLHRADSRALDLFDQVAQGRPGWVLGWDLFCTVVSPVVLRLVTLVLIVVELVRRRVRVAVFLMLTVELSALLTEGAKALADRPRPETAMVDAHGTAFPSGHALGILVIVLALLAVYQRELPPRWREPVVWLGVTIIVAIGLGRVVLNVHHPSDVLAGWALGYLYFLLCLRVCPPYPEPALSTAGDTPAVPDTAR